MGRSRLLGKTWEDLGRLIFQTLDSCRRKGGHIAAVPECQGPIPYLATSPFKDHWSDHPALPGTPIQSTQCPHLLGAGSPLPQSTGWLKGTDPQVLVGRDERQIKINSSRRLLQFSPKPYLRVKRRAEGNTYHHSTLWHAWSRPHVLLFPFLWGSGLPLSVAGWDPLKYLCVPPPAPQVLQVTCSEP